MEAIRQECDVLLELARVGGPREGRVGRGALLGHNTLVRDGAYGAPSPRLHSAHCGSKDGCKILSISKELFSPLTDGRSAPLIHQCPP